MGTGNKKNPPPLHVYIQTRCSFLVIYDLLTHGNFDNPLSKNPRKYFLTFIFPNKQLHFINRHNQNHYEKLLYKRYKIGKKPNNIYIPRTCTCTNVRCIQNPHQSIPHIKNQYLYNLRNDL